MQKKDENSYVSAKEFNDFEKHINNQLDDFEKNLDKHFDELYGNLNEALTKTDNLLTEFENNTKHKFRMFTIRIIILIIISLAIGYFISYKLL